MSNKIFAALFILLISCSSGKPLTNSDARSTPVETETITNIEQQVVQLVNDYRKKKGLPALKVISEATGEAETHSTNMATGAVSFGHDGFNDRFKRLSKELNNINKAAENVAYGDIPVKDIVKGWIESAGHRKNIEGDYNLTGVGVYRKKNGLLYYTQIFLKQKN